MMNLKGVSLSVNTMVYIVLLLLVLILLVLIFTGQIGPIFESVKGYAQQVFNIAPNVSEVAK
jgi:hypothetical protein